MNDQPDDLLPPHQLTAYERRLWVEVDRILYQNYLAPRTVTDFWQGDHAAIATHLKQMKDRAVRLVVIMEYVEVDDVLNNAITRGFFGKQKARKDKKYAALQAMLGRLYLQQKLDIIRSFTDVPRDICSHIMALNDIRNSLAHRFHLDTLPKAKRLYRAKYDLFTKKGLSRFRDDMGGIHEFFQPEIVRLASELVKGQRAQNQKDKASRTHVRRSRGVHNAK